MYGDMCYLFDKGVAPKYTTYGEYYKNCFKNFVLRVPYNLEKRAEKFGDKRLEPFRAQDRKKIERIISEIDMLEDAGIISEFENATIIKARVMDVTLHQKRQLQRLETSDYLIDFGGNGTDWCGGVRGNGYVFKKDKNGAPQQIAVLSPDTSKYLHDILVANYNIKAGCSILDIKYSR